MATVRPEDGEILNVVDVDDRVTGECRRDEIHRLGLLHRAVHVLIFNGAGDLFLQKRAKHKQENPGLWDSSVAGHVDAGEAYDQCCLREVEEEVGLQVTDTPERLFKLPASPITGMEFCWVYRLVTDQALQLDYSEIETGEWFRVTSVDQWVCRAPEGLAESFRLIWSRYRERPELAPSA